MNPHYPKVALRANYRCEYCHAPQVIFNIEFEVDHILPVSQGGSSESDNLALACRACNLRKGIATLRVDKNSNQVIGLFNPRNEAWDEHFLYSTHCHHT